MPFTAIASSSVITSPRARLPELDVRDPVARSLALRGDLRAPRIHAEDLARHSRRGVTFPFPVVTSQSFGFLSRAMGMSKLDLKANQMRSAGDKAATQIQ